MEKIIYQLLSEIRPEIDYSKGGNFIENGMLDSLDIIRLVADLDTKFNISINGADIIPENFKSIEDIIELVKKNGGKG